MSILPEGEQLRKAIKWVSDKRQDAPRAGLPGLVQEACLKFDLSPKDTDVLLNFFLEKESGGSDRRT